VLVHTVDGRDIVEVVQDRTGEATGRWAVR
jgi:hypothetical protein